MSTLSPKTSSPLRLFQPPFLNTKHSHNLPFRPPKPPYPLCSSTPPPPSPIFLPYLQLQQEDEDQQVQENQEHDKPDQENSVNDINPLENEDPLIKFFKTRSSTTQDPPLPAKFTLQSNRRSQWRLAPRFDPEPDADDTRLIIPDKTKSFSNPLPNGVVGEIIKIARELPDNTTLGEHLSGFEKRVNTEKCVEVLRVLGEEGLLSGCLYFYEWMRIQQPSFVSARACTVLFPLLGRSGLGGELLLLFQNLPASKEFRDVHVYNAAISGLLSCARYDDALKVYEDMEGKNVFPDHVTCSIVITVMRKTGRSAKETWEFFERMNRKGVKWSPEVLGAIIKAFCDEGLKNQALVIQTEMDRRGVASNAIVYNTLMDAFVKSNQVEEAEGLLAEMKLKGLKPTSATYNILMDAYSKRMQPDIVEKLLVEMKEAGLEPNVKSYTCLISAYGKQKKMSDLAADAFLRMKKVGIKPTSHSYTALIHAYSISGWHEKASIAFENMQKEGIKPSIETYTALLDAFRRAGDTETLMKIWKLMMHEKVEGTRVTFNILVDGFAKQGHYMDARDVISEFAKFGLHPTLMTYNMLMNAYARGGQHSKLPELLKEMAVLNLKPDSVTFMTMIYAYVRVRDFKRAFYYHKQMVKSGQVPDAKSYEKLRAILDVKAARKNRKDRSAILGIVNSKFGALKVKTKKKKDEFWKIRKNHPRIHNTIREGQ